MSRPGSEISQVEFRKDTGHATSDCLHHRFEGVAQRAPDAIALSVSGRQWTYAALDGWSSAIAAQLRRVTDPDGKHIAVEAPRTAAAIAGLLGCLKAGAAYVPIDPAWPLLRQRAAASIAECQAFVGSGPRLDSKLPAIDPARFDGHRAPRGFESARPPANSHCYVIFTSGSSGQPKGVVVTQHNVARLFDALAESIPLRDGEVWTQYHSIAFGYSVWEIFGALTSGGRLVIVPDTTRVEPDLLAALLQREAVDILSLTPSALRQIALDPGFASHDGSRVPRLVVLSGEPLTAADLGAWFTRFGDSGPALFDTYAITETSGQVTVQCHRWQSGGTDAGNIGRPLSDTPLYVLDDRCQPVPDGDTGELYVGGPGVAAGYAGDPAMTQARFPMMRIGGNPPERVFRTGDRVRRLADGSIRFVGRTDAQLKISGHRVEPGDIETALRRHVHVADAAVATVQHSGRLQLAAWIVPYSGPGAGETVEFWPSVGEHQVYDGLLYHLMSAGSERTRLLRAAIAEHAGGKVVLDLGTGQDALLARMCAEAGARKVYAVEILPDACRRARELVGRLGLDSCIEIIEGDARTIELPEQADVCTHGLTGNIGSADGIAAVLNAARRNLAPDAIVLPGRCRTMLAAASLPPAIRSAPKYDPLAAEYLERIYREAGRRFDVRLAVRNFPASRLLSDSVLFEDLDLNRPVATSGQGSAMLKVRAPGTLDGLLLWTRLDFAPHLQLDHFEHQDAWLPVFMPLVDPLGDAPVDVVPGDRIDLEWRISLSRDQLHPDYEFRAAMRRPGSAPVIVHSRSPYRSGNAGESTLHARLLDSLAEAASRLSASTLRAHAAEHLPEYMVPAQFRFAASLPRNANGKLDRNALTRHAPEHEPVSGEPPFADPLQSDLAAIWREVLGVAELTAGDNFFELGGDSIAAVQMTTALQQLLDEPVRIVALFDAPEIGLLCDYLRERHCAAIARRYNSGHECRHDA